MTRPPQQQQTAFIYNRQIRMPQMTPQGPRGQQQMQFAQPPPAAPGQQQQHAPPPQQQAPPQTSQQAITQPYGAMAQQPNIIMMVSVC